MSEIFYREGVEFRPLKSLCNITKGVQFNRVNMNDSGSYPVINGGVKPSGYIEQYNQNENTITISQGGNSAGYVNWLDCKFWAGAHCYIICPNENEIIKRFLYYVLKSKEYDLQISKYGAAIPALAKSSLENLLIPLPPLEVQRKIIEILDKFTELTRELTRELELRKKQYIYYRDKLLTFDDSVPRKTLGEVLKICNGKDYKQLQEGNIPVYGSGGIMTHVDKYIYDKPSVLIPRKGSLSKLYYVDVPFWNVDTIFYTKIFTEIVEPKFIYYLLQKEHLEKLNISPAVPSLTQSMLNKLVFPIPPLDVQQHIIAILDKFDSLCNDITSGIPAEISARRKQYEYYRDKLLTFKQIDSELPQ